MEKQLLVRLEQPWSSSDVGAFLDATKLAELLPLFSHMEPSAKVRFLLALQVAQQELMRQHLSRERHLNPTGTATAAATASGGLPTHLLKQILGLAEADSDEWVKIVAGLVRKMLFSNTVDEDNFFCECMESTLSQVLSKVEAHMGTDLAIDDWFSHDLAYLNADHPKVANGFKTSNDHFTVLEENKKVTDDKPVASSQPARAPLGNRRPVAVSTAPQPKVPKPVTSSTPTAAAGSMLSKRSLTDVGSEIRRQAESGRFKRQRNRISMIDIDEVKQIESEKAQKAEERKQLARRASKAAANAATDASAEAPAADGGAEGEAAADHTESPPEDQLADAEVPDVATYEAGSTLSEVAEVMQNYQDYSQLMQYDVASNESFVVQEGLQHYDQTSQRGMYQQPQQQQQMPPAPAFPEPISYGQYMDGGQQSYGSGTMSNYEEARAALLQMQQSANSTNQGGEYQYNGGFIDSANYWR
ncbi:hypothetical protein ACHHYP_05112 [Achlya hypogyna]|uniref:Uncharacterized protein n=1 Tax=Achlya hypogyna TaxID=1202772 RepID=A0A1V9YZJ7_ACHHY|nr:hypothetical protein ACHHYP_05112 [Achlya hypogyna]